jgi:hypothetical protein
MYNQNHLYDRLTACMVGQTWPPEFFDWVKDLQVRETLQQIAAETEQDLQQLIQVLESLNVTVVRPQQPTNVDYLKEHVLATGNLPPPLLCPGDHSVMIQTQWYHNFKDCTAIAHAQQPGNALVSAIDDSVCAAMCYQFDDRVVVGRYNHQSSTQAMNIWQQTTNKKVIGFHLPGHIDGWFCPVTPGLIVSAADEQRPELLSMFYRTHFHDHQVFTVMPTLNSNSSFQRWQAQHSGSWWVPGQEHNLSFIHFVNTYLKNWTGYAAETVFDVNTVIVDERTVLVKQTNNERMIRAIESMGVTVHQVPFRHSAFWDSGLHCVTMTLDRSA